MFLNYYIKKKLNRVIFLGWVSISMPLSPLLLIVLLLLVFGGLPNWGYHNYGYGPSGIGGLLLVIVIIMMFSGRLRI